jgi:mono/diheme cytochrome c family protein
MTVLRILPGSSRASRLAAGLALTALWTTAPVGLAQLRSDLGRAEYDSNCISCHGTSGRGDGPFAQQLKRPVPDLTTLTRRNGGVYPRDRVQRIIDGRDDLKGHGGRQMPIWGHRYNQQAAEFYRGAVQEPEAFVRQRVQALTDYVQTLQDLR